MEKKALRGIIPALVTPALEDGSLFEEGLREIMENALAWGAGGFLALGTTGEPTAWTYEEKGRILETVVRQAAGRVPVIAGCGAPTTRETLRLCRLAEEKGADYLAVVTPYYITPTEDDLYEHYRTLAEQTTLPLLLYNIPQRTGNCLSPALVRRLKDLPNVAGIKDSSGDLALFRAFMEFNSEQFQVIQGIDKLFLTSFQLGAQAAISGPANAIPGNQTAIYRLFNQGRLEEARMYQTRFMYLAELIALSPGPTIAKEATNIVGLRAGPPILPLRRPGGQVLERLCQVMREHFSEYFVGEEQGK